MLALGWAPSARRAAGRPDTHGSGPTRPGDRRRGRRPWGGAAGPDRHDPERAERAAPVRRAAVPVVAARPAPGRLGGGRDRGLRVHRLGRRRAGPQAQPDEQVRRPCSTRWPTGCTSSPRSSDWCCATSSRSGWRSLIVGRDVVLAGALVLTRRYGYGPPEVHYLGKAATFCLLYAFPLLLLGTYHGTVADIARPMRGHSRSGARRCTSGPGWCT